jgi:hypothetical protein
MSGWHRFGLVVSLVVFPVLIRHVYLVRWLDIKEDDGLIVRELTAGGSQMLSSELHDHWISILYVEGTMLDCQRFYFIHYYSLCPG